MPIFYMDYELGNDANDGSDWANAWKTLTLGATAIRVAPGDIVRIAKSPAPTSLGTTGVWTSLSKTVTLGAAQTGKISSCEVNWTSGGGDTTPALNTAAKQGTYSVKLTVDASPQVSILQAYRTLAAGATDFSAYQKISFWILNSGAVVADNWIINLCSDTAGATVVDSFAIPAIPSTARWIPLTIARTGGGNLGASIQSIAIYSGGTITGMASKYIHLDNFIACTTGGLNLQSLISKNAAEQGGSEGWYGIQSINGVTVQLDSQTSTAASAGKGYSGTTETVTTYKRETIKTALAASATVTVQQVMDSGSLAGGNLEFQGGYDTSTTVQDGETFFDGLNGYGYGIYIPARTYTTLNYLDVYRYNYGIYYSSGSDSNTITNLSNANNNAYGVYYSGADYNTITNLSNANNNAYGVYYTSSNSNTIITLTNANNNDNYAISYTTSSNNILTTLSNANNNGGNGVYYFTSSINVITTLTNANYNNYGVYYGSSSSSNTITTLTNANYNSSSGVCYNSCGNNTIITLTNANNNDYQGLYLTLNSNNNTVRTLTNANNNGQYGVSFNANSNNNIIKTLSTTGNGIASIYGNSGINYLFNATLAEASEVAGMTALGGGAVYSNKHDGVVGNNWVFMDSAAINSQDTVRHTASDIAWKISVLGVDRSQSYPIELSLAKVAVAADALVTVSVWVYKDSAAAIAAKLICKGGQIAGLETDAIATAADVLQTWEELTITFTPTEQGVVEIIGSAYYVSGNSNAYFDDISISQA